MKTVRELREQLAKEADAAQEIQDLVDAEDRGMTTEEDERWTAHLNKSDELATRADNKERIEKKQAGIAEPAGHVELQVATTPDETKVYATPLRYGQLRAFRGKDANADAKHCSQWMNAVIYKNAEAKQYCRDHNIDMRAQAEGINTAGGFLVPAPMEQAIIDIRQTYGMFANESRIVPMSSDTSDIARRVGGVTATWKGENTEFSDSDKSWDNVTLTAKKLTALTRVSDEFNEDAAINVIDDLASEMGWAFIKKEDEAGNSGTGTTTDGGIVGFRTIMIDNNHATAQYEPTSQDTWASITVGTLTQVMGLVHPQALPNAKWFCSQRAKAGVFDRLALAAGGNTTSQIADGPQFAYSGFPIVVNAAMPVTDTANALDSVIMLAFGDLRLASSMGIRRGIRIQVLTERYADFDQIGVKATERVDIVNHDLGDGTLMSPLIGLLGNT